MIKYEATGLTYYVGDTAPAEIHGFAFVSETALPNYKYTVSSFFLGWNDFIFGGNEGSLDFQFWPNHGMDGDHGASLTLKSGSHTLYSGSETVIVDRPLIQNPSDFVLPNTLRYNCSLNSIDARFQYCDLWLQRTCAQQICKCNSWLCRLFCR